MVFIWTKEYPIYYLHSTLYFSYKEASTLFKHSLELKTKLGDATAHRRQKPMALILAHQTRGKGVKCISSDWLVRLLQNPHSLVPNLAWFPFYSL